VNIADITSLEELTTTSGSVDCVHCSDMYGKSSMCTLSHK